MIAMQYSFTLPADYDMAIIRRRIAEKGHLLDDFPGLLFKAYLYADRSDAQMPSRDNLYAPFYVWREVEGMNAFLGGPGFAALAQAFGWPSVQTFPVWQAEAAAELAAARCASIERIAIAAYAPLDELRRTEGEAARTDSAAGALAAVGAFDPTAWTRLRFRLWTVPQSASERDGRQWYRVGHVSQPRAPH
jgi:Domain of unknown function (DUF4865)